MAVASQMREIPLETLATMSICYVEKFTLDKETIVVYVRSIVCGTDLSLVVHHCERASHGGTASGACIFYKGGCYGRGEGSFNRGESAQDAYLWSVSMP